MTLTNQVVFSSVLAHKDEEGLLPGDEVIREGFINNEAKKTVVLSQMITYLICDELRYGFKSAYEQS